jgi:hypothetical protein
MDLWKTRRDSEKWLRGELLPLAEHLELGFGLIDDSIRLFNEVSEQEKTNFEGQYARICGVASTKGRNFLFACYSVTLDALAQESGAMLRPLIEVVEQLTYFRCDPSRIQHVMDDTLPRAGKIGKDIDGSFQRLRNHLNEEASHFGFGIHSVIHLVDYDTFKFRTVQSHSMERLKHNLSLLSLFQTFLLFESVSCLSRTQIDFNSLANRSENWKKKCDDIFQYDAFRNK